MERRWTTRTKLDVDVDVLFSGGASMSCKTANIGLGGVYLSSNDSQLEKGESVELTFKLDESHNSEACKLRAKVVRLTERGVGLMFKDFDAVAFRSLQKVMKAPLQQ